MSDESRESAELHQLQVAVQELAILNEIASAVSGIWELDQVVDLIVHKCVKHLNVEQGAVMLLNEQDEEKPFQTMVRRIDDSRSEVPYHFGIQLSGWMLKNRKPLLVNDFQSDNRFRMPPTMEFPVRSVLSVPLQIKGRMIGLLNVFNKRTEEGFTPDDQRLLSIIAAQSAQVIEQARLYEEEQALRRIEEDLRVAYEMQTNLLPKENPKVPGYDIAGYSLPAKHVGGDYYDFIPIDDHRLALCLGDISGKGIPAALLMANLQATLRGQAPICNSCADCLHRANTFLYRSTNMEKFATLVYAMLDTKTHQFHYAKAGHTPPLYISGDGTLTKLETGGTILGFFEDASYKEESLNIAPGDLVVMYSDGITEAENPDGDQFEAERLEEVLLGNRERSAAELIPEITSAVQQFTGREFQRDDMTLLVMRRTE